MNEHARGPRQHGGQERPDEAKRCPEVEIQVQVEIRGADVSGGSQSEDRRVVHEHVRGVTKTFMGRGHYALDAFDRGQVGSHSMAADPLRCVLQSGSTPRDEEQTNALCPELLRDRESDPAASTGHHGRGARQDGHRTRATRSLVVFRDLRR